MNEFVSAFAREKLCFYATFPWAQDYRSLIEYASGVGVRGVEFLSCAEFKTPDMAIARELGRLARVNGLLLPCFSVGISLVLEGGRENVEKLKRYADICSELEIPYLHHTVAPKFMERYAPEELDSVNTDGIAAVQEVAEYAKRLGVKTLVEDQGFVFNGVDAYGRFRKAAGDCFDVLLDVGNIYFVDETAGEFAEAFAEDVRHVHVKEYHYTKEQPAGPHYRTLHGNYLSNAVSGEGSIDYDRVKAALKKVNYKGPYAIEYSYKNPDEMYSTFDYLASVFGDM